MEPKHTLRASLSARRSALRTDPGRKQLLDAQILTATLSCMAHYGALDGPVAAYAPLPSEPGAKDFPARLRERASSVWLPISLDDGELAWAQAGEAMQPGALGIAEPVGPRRASEVLKEVRLVIAPAMAVDASGTRLGKGAGYYDRALAHVAGSGVPVAAVVFDHEFYPAPNALPRALHDVAVDAVITPAGFRVL